MRLNPLFKTILFLACAIAVSSGGAIAGDAQISFDGNAKSKTGMTEQIKAMQTETNAPPLVKPPAEDGYEVFIETDTGGLVKLEPQTDKSGGQSYYTMLPGTTSYIRLWCSSSVVNDPNLWSVAVTMRTLPSFAGHNHTSPPPTLADMYSQDNVKHSNPWTAPPLIVNTPLQFWFCPPLYSTRLTMELDYQSSCTSVRTIVFDVKVPDLVPLAAPTSGSGYTLVGATTEHPDNHYVTSSFKTDLESIGSDWHTACPKAAALNYNDASLAWGGVFDLGKNWKNSPGHKGHDKGKNIDIGKREVKSGDRAKLLNIMCNHAHVYSEGNASGESPHYHLNANTSKDEDVERYIPCCPASSHSAPTDTCITLPGGTTTQMPSDCP